MTIVEYPSPQAFAEMGQTDAYVRRAQCDATDGEKN